MEYFEQKKIQWLEGEISPSNSMTLVFHLYYFEIIAYSFSR